MESEFEASLRGMKAVGYFLPLEDEPTSRWRLAWYVFTTFPQWVGAGLNVVKFIVGIDSFSNVVSTVLTIVYGIQSVFRRVFFHFWRPQIAALLRNMQAYPEITSSWFLAEEKEMLRWTKWRIKRFTAFLYFFNGVSIAIYVILPFIASFLEQRTNEEEGPDHDISVSLVRRLDRPLYFDMWWPWDILENPHYQIAFGLELVTVVTCVFNITSTDALAVSLLLSVADRCSLLARAAPRALLPGSFNQLTPEFKDWVRQHQHYVRVVSSINCVMGPLILVTHLLAGFNICIIAYMTIKTSHNIVGITCLVGYFSVLVLQLLVWALAGQAVINQSEKLRSAVLSGRHVGRGAWRDVGTARSALSVVHTRCTICQPQQITGMTFFTTSMEFFCNVMGVAFSYLIVLLQIH